MCKQGKKRSLFTSFYQQLDVQLHSSNQGFSTCNGCLHREIKPQTFTPSSSSPWAFNGEHDTRWYVSPVLTLLTPILKPSPSLFEIGKEAFQGMKQWPKHRCSISALLATNTKHTHISLPYIFIPHMIFLFLHFIVVSWHTFQLFSTFSWQFPLQFPSLFHIPCIH